MFFSRLHGYPIIIQGKRRAGRGRSLNVVLLLCCRTTTAPPSAEATPYPQSATYTAKLRKETGKTKKKEH